MKHRLMHGDCLQELRKLWPDSIDCMVTDPPAGIGFMNKKWDSDKGGRDVWISWMMQVMHESLRVLKPGAHILVWALPRTSHWTMMAIEDAGFEIRDKVTHIFGSGFPKNHDISKAIDKLIGVEREVVGKNMENYRANACKNHQTGQVGSFGLKSEGSHLITAPATEDSKKWNGWGTALKPACEFWILARKPLEEKTVAQNVLKHGTGAINIAESRIPTNENLNGGTYAKNPSPRGGIDMWTEDRKSDTQSFKRGGGGEYKQPEGRWPAHLIHDGSEEVKGIFPDTKTGDVKPHKNAGSWAQLSQEITGQHKGDSGSASRYFKECPPEDAEKFLYIPKISKKDRNEGVEVSKNNHPTVKPTSLMRYLCKMICPVGGVVLDPFMGSGSTGKGAMLEEFDFIGIEQDASYFEIAKERIQHAKQQAEKKYVVEEPKYRNLDLFSNEEVK